MAHLLAGLRGSSASPLLLRAFARPLRSDDRDNLCALLADMVETAPASCRPTVLSFITAEHADLLQEALADPDPRIRRSALGSLPSIKTDLRAYQLFASALDDPDERTRQSAVLHLRWFAESAAVERQTPTAHNAAKPF